MPYVSRRKKVILKLKQLLKKRIQEKIIRHYLKKKNIQEDFLDQIIIYKLENILNNRYLERRKHRKRKFNIFLEDIEPDNRKEKKRSWLTDREFLRKYWCTHKSFDDITNLIKKHSVFDYADYKNIRKEAAGHQLLVLLKFLGSEGAGQSGNELRFCF